MKLFSIFNKPHTKAVNKQAGIVFLEYVIMAFIATVAVICAIWWLYWHLQQMTWEIKDRLNNLPRTCELQPPYGAAPEDQPTPGGVPSFVWNIYEDGEWINSGRDWISPSEATIPYPNQTVVVKNISGGAINYDTYIMFYDKNGYLGTTYDIYVPPLYNPGDEFSAVFSHTGEGPYRVGLFWPFGDYSVTVTPTP